MNDLDQLYQQVILDHSRERHGEGDVDSPHATSHQVNPTCGDEVDLALRVEEGRITALGWHGQGCSISQASISVMHDLVSGADLATVARLEADFDALMHSRGRGVEDTVLDDLDDAAAFEGVSKYPNRVKCALLGWMALKDALAKAGAVLERPGQDGPAGPSPASPSPASSAPAVVSPADHDDTDPQTPKTKEDL